MLYFTAVIPVLVQETNQDYHQYFDKQNKGQSLPLPDIMTSEMFLFLALIIQMGHDIQDAMKEYWSTLDQFYMAFCTNTMKCDRFIHIPHFVHFTDNKQPDRIYENYDNVET
jgi:hypothetical protein